jgi:hypothetical protein
MCKYAGVLDKWLVHMQRLMRIRYLVRQNIHKRTSSSALDVIAHIIVPENANA